MKKESPKSKTMEKKLTKTSSEDKQTTKSIIIITVGLVVIIGLILLSTPITQLIQKSKQKQVLIEYNGFIFSDVEGLWKTHIQKQGTKTVYELSLHYAPWEIVDFPVQGNVLKFFELIEINNLNAMYFTFNLPSQQNNYLALAGAEFSMNIGTVLNLTAKSACTKNITEECKTRPIVDCTKKNAFVIELREEQDEAEQGILINKNCMIIKGNEMTFIKAIDTILYTLYRIPIEERE